MYRGARFDARAWGRVSDILFSPIANQLLAELAADLADSTGTSVRHFRGAGKEYAQLLQVGSPRHGSGPAAGDRISRVISTLAALARRRVLDGSDDASHASDAR